MKRSSAVRLTLVASTATLFAACGREKPKQTLKGYCDPKRPEVCYNQPRAGYMPVYYPMFINGAYYDHTGRVGTAPRSGTPAYRAAQGRSVGTTFTPSGPVSKGGFGSIGGGRSGCCS
jgi:hypothetical protein